MANYSQATINSSHRRLGIFLRLILDGRTVGNKVSIIEALEQFAQDPSEFIEDMHFVDYNVEEYDERQGLFLITINWKLGIKRQNFQTCALYSVNLHLITKIYNLIQGSVVPPISRAAEQSHLLGPSADDEDAPDSLEDEDPEFDLIKTSQ